MGFKTDALIKRNVSEEHLTVPVGNVHKIELLGVPSYKLHTDQKSGDSITEETVHLLESWYCSESTVNMVYDILDMF